MRTVSIIEVVKRLRKDRGLVAIAQTDDGEIIQMASTWNGFQVHVIPANKDPFFIGFLSAWDMLVWYDESYVATGRV